MSEFDLMKLLLVVTWFLIGGWFVVFWAEHGFWWAGGSFGGGLLFWILVGPWIFALPIPAGVWWALIVLIDLLLVRWLVRDGIASLRSRQEGARRAHAAEDLEQLREIGERSRDQVRLVGEELERALRRAAAAPGRKGQP